MHYYQFNISDYKSHTEHLDCLEDLAYRRMLDWTYLHEKSLPKDVSDIARLIRMRSHIDSITVVLREFFEKDAKGNYINKRAQVDIKKYHAKSAAAKRSAEARWNKGEADANALPTESDSNANHKPITNNHKPKKTSARIVKPTLEEVQQYIAEKQYSVDAEAFIAYYESNGWKVGKNIMKSWKAAITTWQKRNGENTNGTHKQSSAKLSAADRVRVANEAIINGTAHSGTVDTHGQDLRPQVGQLIR